MVEEKSNQIILMVINFKNTIYLFTIVFKKSIFCQKYVELNI